MANYYISPEAAFDATADAIRAKTGSQAPIEWTEDGFADAVADIPSGGTDYFNLLLERTITTVTLSQTTLTTPYTFSNQPNLTSVSAPNCTTITSSATYIFENCPMLTNINFPVLRDASATACFSKCGATVVVLPSIAYFGSNTFLRSSSLRILDCGLTNNTFSNKKLFGGNYALQHCYDLETIIIRQTNRIAGLNNVHNLGKTRFYPDGQSYPAGTKGTIYIPKVLYDHLGDGTSLDYKAATNWSTIDANGTVTWAKIEDSYYETHYADGTLIPT